MRKAVRSEILIPAVAMTAVVLASLGYLLFGGSLSPLLPVDAFLLLSISLLSMVLALRRSLSETLFSYTNIGLIGGILFAAVLLISLLWNFIASLGNASFTAWTVYRAILQFPRQFSYYAAFVVLAVSVLLFISNIALIRHEGFRPHNALSLLLAGVYIGGTVAVYAVSDFLEIFFDGVGPAWLPTLNAMISLFLLLMLCYFECILAGSAVMGWLAARRTPALDKDYVLILGCSIDKRGGLLPLLKGRVNRAIRFAWEQEIATGKPLKYIPSGGQGPGEVMSEGSAMELYLLTRGAEPYEVLPEKKSESTYENFCFSKELIEKERPGEKIKVAFATTNYHILRSGILARRAGLDAEGVAGDTKWYFWPNGFVREFFGILVLNIKAHITVAAVAAALCIVIGCVGYFGLFRMAMAL